MIKEPNLFIDTRYFPWVTRIFSESPQLGRRAHLAREPHVARFTVDVAENINVRFLDLSCTHVLRRFRALVKGRPLVELSLSYSTLQQGHPEFHICFFYSKRPRTWMNFQNRPHATPIQLD